MGRRQYLEISEMLESEAEMTEISVQISILETANNHIVVREEKKVYEVGFIYSRNLKIFVWKYISFIFKSYSFEDINGSYIDIAYLLPQLCL